MGARCACFDCHCPCCPCLPVNIIVPLLNGVCPFVCSLRSHFPIRSQLVADPLHLNQLHVCVFLSHNDSSIALLAGVAAAAAAAATAITYSLNILCCPPWSQFTFFFFPLTPFLPPKEYSSSSQEHLVASHSLNTLVAVHAINPDHRISITSRVQLNG